MFVTGLTYHNIVDREPALADFDTSYETSFTGLIAEAKAVIDNRLRALGYDLDKIGAKTDVWDWDNEEVDPLDKEITSPSSTQNLLMLCFKEGISTGTLRVFGVNGHVIYNEILTAGGGETVSRLLPYLDTTITIRLTQNSPFDVNAVKAYLTDPAIYFIHLYKSLELIYETMRSAPGDLFEMKSNYYHNLYETEFNSLATYYDRNGDGTMQNEEMQHMKRARILR